MKLLNKTHFFAFSCTILACCALFFGNTTVLAAERVQPVDEEIVIVIDPGHGGDNKGTQSGHTVEKKMTMITAQAMYDELSKYDNVKIYFTHTEDVDVSLKDRAAFAASVNADFLFSLHYNASENHNMFGSEVWISCQKPFNAYGYQFGYLFLQSMEEKGLFIRGVKNRQDTPGVDYYGIIRESAALDIPAVIIEHCYVDAACEAQYIANEDGYKEFGKADATAVAKYFGLKSTSLGIDYSEEAKKLQPASADALVASTLPDKTRPDICEIELTECNYQTGDITLTVRAADYDSPLIYYSYSTDGGSKWNDLEMWPGSNTLTGEYTDTFQLKLKMAEGSRPRVVLRAINISDLEKKSNTITFDQAFDKNTSGDTTSTGSTTAAADTTPSDPSSDTSGITSTISDTTGSSGAAENAEVPSTVPAEREHHTIGTTTFMPVLSDELEESEDVGVLSFLKICLILVAALFLIVLTSQTVSYQRKKKRRQRK